MIEVTTKSGFTAEINENAFDDMRFLDLVCDMDDGKPQALRGMIKLILNADDEKRLYDHVKTDDGRVPVSALNAEMQSIMEGVGAKK